ncbi:hypothetical protein ANCCAN_10338 [Ancylostoma caninum]|uniref:Uncharacterized protein n=1 Tax=Ancylostoma caninum TaxID=29170 RepID=A0A368GH38_ANCCA|nr:hypothetical protein ANCCAN_10338 [Ancylostoma caninum]
MKDLYADDPPFIDVALTLRSCGCGYMIVLAMYLNTLLLIAINLKVGIRPQEDEMPQLVFQTSPPREAKPTPEKKESDVGPIGKYEEAHTQEEPEPVSRKWLIATSVDKTLKSARMSIRLPRAPKGHHDEELEQMEKFLAEDDMSAIEK